jgi:AAA+ superfamily predicted ATPase
VALGEPGPDAAAPADGGGPELMERVSPRFSLDDFICPPAFRRVLDDVVFYARRYPEIRARVGVESVTRSFLVNFFGESGTGKTMAAEAFARELGKDLYVMNFANVESSLLGRTPKNISRAFRAVSPESAIIMLDEADAFVSRRIVDLRQGAEYALNAARGQIIGEIDRFEGTVILATNLFGTYDNAILRRIKFNLMFELPTEAAVAAMLGRFLGGDPTIRVDFDGLARSAAGLSGGDIYNISEILVMKSLQRSEAGKPPVGEDEIEEIVSYYRSKAPAVRPVAE